MGDKMKNCCQWKGKTIPWIEIYFFLMTVAYVIWRVAVFLKKV